MKHIFIFCSIVLSVTSCLSFTSCQKNNAETPITEPPIKVDSIPTSQYNLAILSYCNLFSKTPTVKTIANQSYGELSGIAASQKSEGIFYMQEDNNSRNVYLTNKNGDDLGKITLDNAGSSNWEDIAVGPGPEPGKTYVYVADIGDNNAKASFVSIYRFEEPEIVNPNATTQVNITNFDRINLSYSKGSADAETFMVDPLTKSIFILTKQNYKSYVYQAKYPQSTTSTTKMDVLAILNLDLLTAGDISSDGSEILLRNKSQIWYWKRDAGQNIVQTLLKSPQDAPYAANEKQGEGICFTSNSNGYLTNTEILKYSGTISALSYYPRQ